MDVDEDDIARLVQEAIEEIERENATDVLIIEDEPVISMQLEALVSELGHNVVGIAATRTEALADRRRKHARPGPGRHPAGRRVSGIDAVKDILELRRRAGDLHHRLSPSAC